MKLKLQFACFMLLAPIALAGNHMKLEELTRVTHYSTEKWEARGLNPSSEQVIALMNQATSEFFQELILLRERIGLNKDELSSEVMKIANSIPWYQFDTEEKEFLPDTLAPAITSLGLNPWHYF